MCHSEGFYNSEDTVDFNFALCFVDRMKDQDNNVATIQMVLQYLVHVEVEVLIDLL